MSGDSDTITKINKNKCIDSKKDEQNDIMIIES